MQGSRGPSTQPALTRVPRSEDLQKLLKQMQQSGGLVQQPFAMDGGPRMVLRVQPAKTGAGGLGKARGSATSPLWSLLEGVNTLWEYNTTDLELIFNLTEEAALAASRDNGSQANKSEEALAVLENMAAAHGISGIGFPSSAQTDSQASQSGGFGSQQGGNFSSSSSGGSFNTGGYSSQSSSSFSSSPTNSGGFSAAEQPGASPKSSGQFNNPAYGNAAAAQAAPPARSSKHSTPAVQMQMSGNISDLGICDLFQSISVAKMTGRLDVTSGLESIEIYFEEGMPRRASFRSDTMTGAEKNITGEEVLLEGMTWKTGFFQFNASLKSAERSPMRRLDLLLLEGSALKDYGDALEKAGFTPESVPLRIKQVSEAEFEKALSEGIPVNIEKQKAIYVAFTGKTMLMDVVRDCGLPKSAWLPLVFNLHNCGLIGFPGKLTVAAPPVDIAQSPMMKEQIKEAFQDMLRADTSLLSYPLIMHFLEIEFQRALKLRQPFCLAIIGVQKEGGGVSEQLSTDDLKLLADRLRSKLEPFDHVGHYQTLDLALIMPHRASAQGREFVSNFINEFNRELAQTGNNVRMVWSVGMGCVPEDGIKLSGMVNRAEQERKNAQANR